MLDLRPCCENCEKPLPPNSTEAYICSFECTFCETCTFEKLYNVCPNCGGGFSKRPPRPKGMLDPYPASKTKVVKPVEWLKHELLVEEWKDVPPEKR